VICDHVWLIRPGQGIDRYAAKGSDRLIVAGISELGDLHDGGDSPIKGALSESHGMVELVVVVEVGCAILCRCAIVRCCSGQDFLGVEVVQANLAMISPAIVQKVQLALIFPLKYIVTVWIYRQPGTLAQSQPSFQP
jgi:hypothetical protein